MANKKKSQVFFYNFSLSMMGHTDWLQSFDKCVVNKDIIEMIHQDLFEKRFEMISPPLMKSLQQRFFSLIFLEMSKLSSQKDIQLWFWKIRTFLSKQSWSSWQNYPNTLKEHQRRKIQGKVPRFHRLLQSHHLYHRPKLLFQPL